MAFYPEYLDAYFAPLSPSMNAFIGKYELILEKYHHDAPIWSICFGHPKGGQAKIDISVESEEFVIIQAIWWLDDYAKSTRSLRWSEKYHVPRNPSDSSVTLHRLFHEVLQWELGIWTEVAEGYQEVWSSFTAESFNTWANPWNKPNAEQSTLLDSGSQPGMTRQKNGS